MIAIEKARVRVDKRLERLGLNDDRPRGESPLRDGMLLCSGTDVAGPELMHEIGTATVELLELFAEGGDAAPKIAGMLTRTFWLGYELGRESDA